MALPDPVFKLMNGIHRTLFDLTKGAGFTGRMAGMDVVKLETTGRKSGKTRTTMLTSPPTDGDDIVLIASKGGDDHHPAWYLNLQANPDVKLIMRGEQVDATARTASDDEKAALWPQITGTYKGYANYQQSTDRDIPVVLCTPKG